MNKLSILSVLSVITILIISPILAEKQVESEAQSPPTHFIDVKAVVQFEHSANLSQVRAYYDSTVKPQVVTLINQYSANIDNFSYRTDPTENALYVIMINEETGNNIYELYPDTTFFGTLPNGVTKQQFENGFNNFLTDVKNVIKSELQSNGATIIKSHIHYTYGSVDEFEP